MEKKTIDCLDLTITIRCDLGGMRVPQNVYESLLKVQEREIDIINQYDKKPYMVDVYEWIVSEYLGIDGPGNHVEITIDDMYIIDEDEEEYGEEE